MPTPNNNPPSAAPISHPPHEFGDTNAPPFVAVDNPMTPFTKNCHAQLNVVVDHLPGNTEAKHRGVDDLLEQTSQVHNLLVCTLGSYCPRPVVGLPPEWCKSKPYRARAAKEPGRLLRDFGIRVADDVTMRAHDNNANTRFLVVPMRARGTESLSAPELAVLVTRDTMIGVSTVKAPEPVAAGRR